jgi:hypothetical protein
MGMQAHHVGVTTMRALTKVLTIQTFISRASVMGSDPTKELAMQPIADYSESLQCVRFILVCALAYLETT